MQSIFIPSQIQDWYREDKLWAKDRRYSSRLWIQWTENTEIRITLTWKHHVLHGTSRQSGRNIKTRSIRSTKLAQKKGFKFCQTRSNAIILFDTLPAKCIPKANMMGTGEIKNEKVYASPQLPLRFPLKIIGWEKWVQKLLEVVKSPNKPNQDQKPNYQARWDLRRVSNHLVCLLRRSKKMQWRSKTMIREKGNVELFELCETIPKVQCSQCLLYWN